MAVSLRIAFGRQPQCIGIALDHGAQRGAAAVQPVDAVQTGPHQIGRGRRTGGQARGGILEIGCVAIGTGSRGLR
jgi:hypothetical protein